MTSHIRFGASCENIWLNLRRLGDNPGWVWVDSGGIKASGQRSQKVVAWVKQNVTICYEFDTFAASLGSSGLCLMIGEEWWRFGFEFDEWRWNGERFEVIHGKFRDIWARLVQLGQVIWIELEQVRSKLGHIEWSLRRIGTIDVSWAELRWMEANWNWSGHIARSLRPKWDMLWCLKSDEGKSRNIVDEGETNWGELHWIPSRSDDIGTN